MFKDLSKKLLLAAIILVLCLGIPGVDGAQASSPASKWMWEAGSNIRNQNGVYALFTPLGPGSREFAAAWTDGTGNPWMFGGWSLDMNGDTGSMNDMWKFDLATREWKRKDGPATVQYPGTYGTLETFASANLPVGRQGTATWVDSNGNFWMFGGRNTDNGNITLYSDLWQFDPDISQWAWMDGLNTTDQPGEYGTEDVAHANNIPGARYGAATWMDVYGNFWMFGGYGFDANGVEGWLNDLWKYNPSTKMWTWVDGSKFYAQVGTYGTLGTGSSSNVPGARFQSAAWSDSNGNLWLFGGYGFAKNLTAGYLNDLWKFTPSNGQWTWMGGGDVRNQATVFGTKGLESSTNIPGARQGTAFWKDNSGSFWLFGGDVWEDATAGDRNDLWRYNPTNGQWAWMGGSQLTDEPGIYGTQDLPGSANLPGARYGGSAWVDANGDFWLFGGHGNDSTVNTGKLNDLWKFVDVPSIIMNSQAALDGHVLESGEKSNKGGSKNSTASSFNLGDDSANKQYRAILSFDTTLPANAEIVSVTLRIKKAGQVGGKNPITLFGGFVVDFKANYFGTKPALATGDFQAAAGGNLGPTKPAPVNGWYSIDLSTAKAQINPAGSTQIRLRFAKDDNNNSAANILKIYSGNAGVNAPQLIVEYYVP